MTVKFDKSLATQLVIPDSANNTLTGDFAIGAVVMFDGDVTSTSTQTLFASGAYSEVGNYICMWNPPTASSLAGKFYYQLNGGTASQCSVGPVEAGKAYVLVLQRSAGVVTSKLCPVLTVDPADGSSVISSTSINNDKVWDAPRDLIIGAHYTTNRRFAQSVGRFFRIDRALSDLEIAQLAYGKEITQFVTPLMYIRANDETDLVDSGSQANTVTASGTFTNGGDPGFGYSSVPTAPVFNGAPVITGSPTPGVATGYTQALVTGNPSPTVTQQWSIDGVDVAGATGATYTPAAGDVGKQLRVRQIATNEAGTATATSDPALVTSEAASITPTEIPAEAIYQQVAGVASVPVSVAYSGLSPSTLEYQLYAPDGATVVKAWANTGIAPENGAFSGDVSMPTPTNGQKYRIAYRTKDAGGNVLVSSGVMVNRFGVGDIFIGIGSSSMAAWFTSGSGANMTVDHMVASYYDTTNGWVKFDTYGQAGQMAVYMAQQLGYPVAFTQRALGGSQLSEWASKTSTVFTNFLSTLSGVGGKIRGILSTCGSNDITGETNSRAYTTHLAELRQLAANLREATNNPNLPILLSGINRRTNSNDTAANNARAAERAFGDDPNNYHVQTLDFELSSDGTHLTGSGYRGCCDRVRYVWVEALNGTHRRGPAIASMRFSGNQVNVALTHRSGNDFTPLAGITGFRVTDDKGDGIPVDVAITSCARTNAGNILIDCDQALVAPKVTYLAGQGPEVGTPVYDNGPVPLPMTAEAFMVTSAGAIEQPLTLVPYYAERPLSWAIEGNGVTLVSNDYTISYAIESMPLVSSDYTLTYAILSGAAMSFTPSPSRTLTVSPTSKALTGGPWWNLANPAKPRGTKDPQAVLDVTLNWAPWLADIGNPLIAKFTATIFGVTQVGAYAEGALTTMVFGGGTDAEATITFEIETATTPPLKDERTVYIDLMNL